MIKLKSLLNEDVNSLLNDVKYSLYEWEGYSSWKEFVDHQEMGNCQSIVAAIIQDFPQFKKQFGHIILESPIISNENGEEIERITHHWVSLNGIPYEFSKGTLKNHILFKDLYSVEIEDINIYNHL